MFLRFLIFFVVGLVGTFGLIQTIGNSFVVSFVMAAVLGVLGAMTKYAG